MSYSLRSESPFCNCLDMPITASFHNESLIDVFSKVCELACCDCVPTKTGLMAIRDTSAMNSPIRKDTTLISGLPASELRKIRENPERYFFERCGEWNFRDTVSMDNSGNTLIVIGRPQEIDGVHDVLKKAGKVGFHVSPTHEIYNEIKALTARE